jgi:CHAT domain-containing protein
LEAFQRRDAERESLSNEVEKLEAGLARKVAGLGNTRLALSVTVEQVQGVLAPDQALVELLRYEHQLPAGIRKGEARYGAVVIASSGEPHWVALGPAAEMEKDVSDYEKAVRGALDASGQSMLPSTLRSLYDHLWAPIEKSLPPGVKTIILSPDGDLNFVSFAALVAPDDQFIAEKYSIRYVASGRDLLREISPSNSQLMAVFGNPVFRGEKKVGANRLAAGTAGSPRGLELRDYAGIALPALPSTAAECAFLKDQARSSKIPCQVFEGAEATEAQLRRVVSPRILHLATHGFFLPEAAEPTGNGANPIGLLSASFTQERRAVLKNPMHRSGLALAGAQRTLDAWARGEAPPADDDGIVTAEEVGGLDLQGTWLVTLSACDTGTGEARAGEGVMGLRRGFIQAGAQNLLMTLWEISDETTVEIMKDFYARALKTGNAPQALADTEREWLVKLRKEKGLAEAVTLAGPFIMSSQGKP